MTLITPERIVVELRLTPARVVALERYCGLKLRWFNRTHAVLKRHKLIPKSRDWNEWLVRYEKRRAELGLT